MCMWTGGNDRTLMAHCPEEYNQIEIDDVETGERLTLCARSQAERLLPLRLQASPDRKRLLSAGWVWHPLDAILMLRCRGGAEETREAEAPRRDGMARRRRFPDTGRNVRASGRQMSACWTKSAAKVLDDEAEITPGSSPRLMPNGVLLHDVAARASIASIQLGYPGRR